MTNTEDKVFQFDVNYHKGGDLIWITLKCNGFTVAPRRLRIWPWDSDRSVWKKIGKMRLKMAAQYMKDSEKYEGIAQVCKAYSSDRFEIKKEKKAKLRLIRL